MTEENKAIDPSEEASSAEATPKPANELSPKEIAPANNESPAITEMETVPGTEEQFLEAAPQVLADETHDDEEADVQEDYSSHTREELIVMLEKFVNETEVPRFKARIAGIREFLNHAFAAENDLAFTKFIEEGGNKDDFKPATDPLEERFHQALKRFFKKRTEYQEKQEKQKTENLHGKNDLLQQLKDLIQNEDNMNKAFDRFHELQAKWRAIGPVPAANVRDLQMTYKFLIDKFYDYIKINRELQDLDQRRNFETKLSICEQADELLMEPSLNVALRKLHMLQDKWRETGPVPRDKKNEIWDRFKATCDKLFDKRKEQIAQSDEKRVANLTEKTKLCEAVETIKTDDNWKHKEWQEATLSIGELQTAWKKIGPADKKFNDEIWNRFKATCDAFYKAKNDFYHKRKQEFAANLQQKTELCIQAEALQNSTDWKTTTAELIRLQQEWKKGGSVGDKHSEKIWKRFRTACDAFFKNKSDHFSVLDKEHDENLVKKITLIEEIENYQLNDDYATSFEELKAFQRRWSEMGMVPLNKKEEIMNRFKKAIDGHFDKLKVSSNDRQKVRYQQKQDHIRHSDSGGKMDSERKSLLHKITELKNEVQVWENNIGFFAKSKNAEKLKSEFEEKIKNAKEEISKLKGKLDMVKDVD